MQDSPLDITFWIIEVIETMSPELMQPSIQELVGSGKFKAGPVQGRIIAPVVDEGVPKTLVIIPPFEFPEPELPYEPDEPDEPNEPYEPDEL